MEINECSCGCSANIKKSIVNFGQGSYGQEFWVESECGIRGKSFDTYDLDNKGASAKAIEFWNNHFSNDRRIT